MKNLGFGFYFIAVMYGSVCNAQGTTIPATIPIATFTDSPNTATLSARTSPAISTGAHPGIARYGNQFSMVTDGSSVQAGPQSADYAVNIAVRKRDFLNNNTAGEIDGLDIAARNGIGDTAGMLANVGTRRGFAGVVEGVAYIFSDAGQPVLGSRAILGSVTYTGLPGGYSSNGLVTYAETGIGTSAINVTAKLGASWTNAMQIRLDDDSPVNFDIDGNGRLMNLGKAQGASDVRLTLGQGRTNAGNSYIDLIGDTEARPYGLRVVRNGGANGISGIIHSGTGQLTINAADAGSVAIQSAGVNRILVNADGIGFNGNAPITKRVLSPALPENGTATNAAIASLVNQLRATLIQYGLAQ